MADSSMRRYKMGGVVNVELNKPTPAVRTLTLQACGSLAAVLSGARQL